MAEATVKLPHFSSISDPCWVCLDNFAFVVPIIWIFSTGKHTEMMTRLRRSACWVWVYIEWELLFSPVLQYCAVLMLAWLVHYSGYRSGSCRHRSCSEKVQLYQQKHRHTVFGQSHIFKATGTFLRCAKDIQATCTNAQQSTGNAATVHNS